MKVSVSKSDNSKKKYKIVLHYEDGKTKTIHITTVVSPLACTLLKND